MPLNGLKLKFIHPQVRFDYQNVILYDLSLVWPFFLSLVSNFVLTDSMNMDGVIQYEYVSFML